MLGRPSRASRKRRGGEEVARTDVVVPNVMDDIVVLWILGSEHIWWPATVLQVDDENGSAESGIGIIEYCDHGRHKSCTSQVRFYRTKSGDRVLRDAEDCPDSTICNSWRFVSEPRAESQIEAKRHVDCHASGGTSQPGKKHRSGDQSGTDSVLVPRFLVNKWKKLEDTVRCLRQDLLLMMTKPATESMLLFLRNELLLALDQDFGFPRTVVNCQVSDIFCSSLQVTVPCTLNDMQRLARRICESEYPLAACLPSALRDQRHWSLATTEVVIRLHTLRHLCCVLNMKQEEDYNRMLCRLSTRAGGKSTLFLLGSAGQGVTSNEDDSVTFNRIVLGSSVYGVRDTGLSASCAPCSPPDGLLLEQRRVGWDDGLKWFTAPWCRAVPIEEQPTPPFELKDMTGSPFAAEKHGFCVMWSKGAEPNSRHWSMDARHSAGEVLGALTLNVPTVALSGHEVVMGVVDAVEQHMGVHMRGRM